MISMAVYTAAKTPNASQRARQLPLPVVGSGPPSNTSNNSLPDSLHLIPLITHYQTVFMIHHAPLSVFLV